MGSLFETIIVGAGPGGLVCGKYLNNALILDQKEEIGKPVQCAEGLARYFLDRLGIKPDPNWISTTVDKSQAVLPNGKTANLSAKEGGYILDRVNFEKFLASQCQARIRLQKRVTDVKKEGETWRVKTQDGEEFESKYLIGADGPASIIRRKVFQEKVAIYPCLQYLVEVEKEMDCHTMKLYFDQERFPSGYAWFFPKSRNTANIGLGSGRKINLRAQLEDFMENTIRKDLGNYRFLKNISGVIPLVKKSIKLVKDNALLVGDAGAMVDPITGGGIGNAMIAGEQAAKCILSKDVDSYPSKIEFLSCFNEKLFLAQEVLYSLDNKSLNEVGEVLEKAGEDIFYLKSLSALPDFLAKPNLRKNIFKFLKLILVYRNHTCSKR
ncbi:MAG TPA: NAD(P)/FAD-dependent oxidoreductase [Candidatus Humimicrobiaceae bacterium]|nr:NAD(P)/FAD-dependent oxidoreductase [Candidatus Humimicrobiaceae bacterium]